MTDEIFYHSKMGDNVGDMPEFIVAAFDALVTYIDDYNLLCGKEMFFLGEHASIWLNNNIFIDAPEFLGTLVKDVATIASCDSTSEAMYIFVRKINSGGCELLVFRANDISKEFKTIRDLAARIVVDTLINKMKKQSQESPGA